jgi:hypothetical protein
MPSPEPAPPAEPDAALDAFGLLADGERLRVVAAVVLGAADPDDVVAATSLPRRRVLEALTRLEAGELLGRDATGRWSVDVRRLQSLAAAARPKPPLDDVGDAPPDRAAVLQRFFREGRLLALPTQHSRRLVVLDHIARVFELGVRYPERDVNAMLRAFYDDVAALRRYLVDEGYLSRDHGIYWRSGGSVDL